MLQGHVCHQAAPHQTTLSHLLVALQIAIETTPFPKGEKGDSLDRLARQYLYADGLNFGHGVGHGIGSYLGVSGVLYIATVPQAHHVY